MRRHRAESLVIHAVAAIRTTKGPLGENWPFSGREFDWEKGEDLDGARRDLAQLITLLEQGRGDEILVHPLTQRPLAEGQ